jgi:DNA-binding CsgD family transcriptional regulator
MKRLITDENHYLYDYQQGLKATYGIDKIFYTLSKREQECLYYVIRGLSASQISSRLIISKRTVEDYIDRVKNKLGCTTRLELLNFAFENSLLIYNGPK